MLLSFAFGTCPPPSSLRLPPGPSLRSTSALRPLPKEPSRNARARLHPALAIVCVVPVARPIAPSRRHRRMVLLRLLAQHGRSRRHWVPSTPTNPRSRGRLVRSCDLTPNRLGLPLPALPVSRICQPYFMPGRPWAPALQRFLPALCRQTLSGPAVPLAVSHLAVSQLRGFQHRAPPSSCDSDSTRCADACSSDDVVHAINGSLLSWLFPPFEADLPASSRTSAGLLSWASIVHGSLWFPLRVA